MFAIRRLIVLTFLAVLVTALGAPPLLAQPEGLRQVDPKALGLTEEGIERLFVQARTTPRFTEPAERVESLRVFYDRQLAERGLARAEVRGASLGEAETLRLAIAEEPIDFRDDGKAPDREAGDGILTAAVPLRLGDLLGRALDRRPAQPQTDAPRFDGRELISETADTQRRGRAVDPQLRERLVLEPRLRERLADLERLAPRLRRMPDLQVIRALSIDPAEPILEIERVGNQFVETLVRIPGPFFFNVLPGNVSINRSLMVTAVPVIEDPGRTFDPCTGLGTPGGPWTFGHLMREMSIGSGMNPRDFTLFWLNTWLLPQVANGFIVNDPARAMQLQNLVINPWLAAGGDVDRFPARLFAIVNRPDLAAASGYSAPGSGGEGRFVFGLLNGCASLPFTVIFEYRKPVKGCFGLKGWQQQWKDLDNHPLGSPAYNMALEAITRQFTDHGSNMDQHPNQSALGQLRTNEIALAGPWELREFTLQGPGSSAPGMLGLVTVKQTPDLTFNNSPTLSAYITANQADILADDHVIPLRFPNLFSPFLAATAPTPFAFFWQAPGILPLPDGPDLVQKVSLATCNGCHAGETNTLFTHIGANGTRNPGAPAQLSGFLTGMVMPDPRVPAIPRAFNDLALRQQAMADVLNKSCFRLSLKARVLPAAFVH